MSDIDITVPSGWNQLDAQFDQQEFVFQRSRDGLVLSIESGTTSDAYAVAFLPENFSQDNQVIRSYGDNGYLYSGDSLAVAVDEATTWMEENPR